MTASNQALSARIARVPAVHDAAAAARGLADLAAAAPDLAPALVQDGAERSLFAGALGSSPYLARLARRWPEAAARALLSPLEAERDRLVAALAGAGAAPSLAAAGVALRQTKEQLHLLVALADLAGAWDLAAVTKSLSDAADAAIAAALQAVARSETARGRLPPTGQDAGTAPPGLFVVALGKLGAGELNYSSDVDICVYYDRARFPVAEGAGQAATRLAQGLARALQEITGDGYAFRVDFRLRPDPGATAPALSTDAALRYYESLGQTWERAAHIKARPCAGDRQAADAFLAELGPFVWRRTLDFAALEDIHAMLRQVRSAAGADALAVAGADLKRGLGGVREIELFVQTQQLLFGGRDRALRVPATVRALTALARAGHVLPADALELAEHYAALREVEHRLQMVDDQQTHRVPLDPDRRLRVARLAGVETLAAFDEALRARLGRVHAICLARFPADDSRAAQRLVIPAIDDDPATLAAMAEAGFADAAGALAVMRGWRAGRARATRSERARASLERVLPLVFQAAAETGEPDLAFRRFAEFFEGLSAGVSLLALFANEPAFLRDVVTLLTLSPRLGAALARQPAALDVMLEPAFFGSLAEGRGEAVAARAAAAIASAAEDFERALDAARRVGREEALRIGAHLLLERATPQEAGAAYSDLADALIAPLAEAARAEVARRAGSIAGDVVIIGLGKLGGREMSAGSDLDLMAVYDAPDGAVSDGERPLSADHYFGRVTQRLIAALSAPTREGALYEVDMRLRPSGAKGPIAVRASAFERYYAEEAWTWELMALTRARIVAGSERLAGRMRGVIAQALRRPRDRVALARDVAAMRARVAAERPARGRWDMRDAPGGLIDVEFAAQFLQLALAADHPDVLDVGTLEALARIAALPVPEAPQAAALARAGRLQLDLSQLLRLAVEGRPQPEMLPARLARALARVAGAADLAELEARLDAAQRQAHAAMALLLACPDEQGEHAGDGAGRDPRLTS